MVNFSDLWDVSGDQYHRYNQKYPQHKRTNTKLVELANIKPDHVLVDLGCGTGLTSQEVLSKVHDIKKIFAIDFSKDMTRIAKDFIRSDKITFIIADALNLSKVLNQKANRVLCNATFCQFPDYDEVLKSIEKIIKNEGIFVFNLSQLFFDFGVEEHIQDLILEEIFLKMKKMGYSTQGIMKPKSTLDDIKNLASRNHFTLEKYEYHDFGPRTLRQVLDFFKVPATAMFFNKVPEIDREIILSEVYDKLKNDIKEIPENKWAYFVLRKLPTWS